MKKIAARQRTDAIALPRQSLTAAVALALSSVSTATLAATITVDTSSPDVSAGDSQCSLAEAITNANDNTATFADCAAGDGNDTIELPASQTITLTQALPGIGNGGAGSLTISGNDATIQRDPLLNCTLDNSPAPEEFGLLSVAYDPLTMSSVTLANGCNDSNFSRGGGAIFAEYANLSLDNVTLQDNQARVGGAIDAYRSPGVSVTNSVLTNNTAAQNGGAIRGYYSDVTVSDSTLDNNSARRGGAINHYYAGSLSLTSVTLQANTANLGSGGAVYGYGTNTVSITGGAITANSASGGGGAIYARYHGRLLVDGVTISQNNAGGDGGVLYSYGSSSIAISNSQISGNTAGGGGGVLSTYDSGTTTISDSSLSGNRAAGRDGGVAYFYNASGRIERSVIDGNTAEGDGGAVAIYSGFGTGETLAIVDTVINNNAAEIGGAISATSNFGAPGISLGLTIEGSTLSNNSVTGNGGALFSSHSSATITVARSTFSANTANQGGGLNVFNGASISVSDSTLADNTAATTGDQVYFSESSHNVARTLLVGSGTSNCVLSASTGAENNLSTDASCASIATQDSLANIALAPLGDNGGPTPTHALLPTSTAIDAGAVGCAATDQRGEARPFSAACDIGAFELQAQPGPNFVVNALGDNGDGACGQVLGECTLRDAVLAANANADSSEITFDPAVFSAGATVTLTQAQLEMNTGAITVTGNGTVIERDSAAGLDCALSGQGPGGQVEPHEFRLLETTNVDVTLNDITLQGGCADQGLGGAILQNGGVLTANSVNFLNNQASYPGGAIQSYSGSVVINDSEISGNTSGIIGGGISALGSAVNVNNSQLTNNQSTYTGGAITAYGALVVAGSVLSGNTTGYVGGAIYGAYNVDVQSSTLRDNSAGIAGGAVYMGSSSGQSLTMRSTTLTGNQADTGGAIATSDSSLDLLNVTLSANQASQAGALAAVGLGGRSFNLQNTTFVDNQSSSGGQLSINGAPGSSAINRNVLVGNSANCQLIGLPGFGSDNFTTDNSCGGTVADRQAIALGSLSDNGGPTQTHLPQPGSALIDVATGCSATDQRGLARPVDADGIGTEQCDVGAIEVQNTPVEAQADTASTDQDTALPVGGDLLGNDVDVLDEDAGVLTIVAVEGGSGSVGAAISPAAGGEVVINSDGSFQFDPLSDFVALDSGESASVVVGHTVSDGIADSTTSLTITVNGLNDVPLAMNDAFTVSGGIRLTVDAAGGLLANDSDPDIEGLTVTSTGSIVAGGIGGTVTINADGSFEYDAPVTQGVATFDYTISDGELQATGSAQITVTEPVAADLQIDKSDGVDAVNVNDVLTYTIAIVNAGPVDVVGATVEDLLPPELSNVTWTCEAIGNAVCANRVGAGILRQQVDIPVNDAVVYELMATATEVNGQLINTAIVTPPAGTPDPDLSNNTAIDINLADQLFSDSFETTVIRKSYQAGQVVLTAQQIEQRLNKLAGFAPALLVHAQDVAQPSLNMALIHGRWLDDEVQLRVTRYVAGQWLLGEWTTLQEDTVQLNW